MPLPLMVLEDRKEREKRSTKVIIEMLNISIITFVEHFYYH